MGKIKKPEPALLFTGILYKNEKDFEIIKNELEAYIDRIDFISYPIEFIYTDYYSLEIGKNLKRRFLGFKNLIEQDSISNIKIKTNDIENKYAKNNKRIFNLDPGYLLRSRIILASTKDFSHRIYTGKNIYCEVTLRYIKGKFTTLPWTYPDFASKEYQEIFIKIRNLYINKLKKGGTE